MLRDTRILMGMPITIEIVDAVDVSILEEVYGYFADVEERFSVFKDTSEISAFNQGRISTSDFSADMQEVLTIAERTKNQSDGYFEIRKPDGSLNPSGIVKGWAIRNAARLLQTKDVVNFFVDAGGDIQTGGHNCEGQDWRVGIRNPFNSAEIIKALVLKGNGIATSGTYVRGQHIYNPHVPTEPIDDIISLTVIGPDVLEADRFATAAFAMGHDGIYFIEEMAGFEGYMVDAKGIATQTSGFGGYVIK